MFRNAVSGAVQPAFACGKVFLIPSHPMGTGCSRPPAQGDLATRPNPLRIAVNELVSITARRTGTHFRRVAVRLHAPNKEVE
jgi:hypothetical protein